MSLGAFPLRRWKSALHAYAHLVMSSSQLSSTMQSAKGNWLRDWKARPRSGFFICALTLQTALRPIILDVVLRARGQFVPEAGYVTHVAPRSSTFLDKYQSGIKVYGLTTKGPDHGGSLHRAKTTCPRCFERFLLSNRRHPYRGGSESKFRTGRTGRNPLPSPE